MSPSAPIGFRIDGPAATIALNRVHRHNALDLDCVTELLQLLSDCHGEKRVRAVILTGKGDTFCSGTDLHHLQASFEKTQTTDMFQSWQLQSQQYLQLIETMLRYPKPIIVAANGPVIGIGLALMLAADYAIGSQTAYLQSPEARLGLSASLTAPLLNFRTSTSVANRLLLTSDKLDAEAALKVGLFHENVLPDLVWARAFEVAQQCALGARETHQMTKQMLNETIGETLITQLTVGAANLAAARITDAAKEGVAAFLEKREPNWG